jgi:hypothetical protein
MINQKLQFDFAALRLGSDWIEGYGLTFAQPKQNPNM